MKAETKMQAGWQIRVELPFNGKPYDFVQAVYLSHEKLREDLCEPGLFPVALLDQPYTDQNVESVRAHIVDTRDEMEISITVEKLPTETLLFAKSYKQDWDALEKSWRLFERFLQEYGWIGTKPIANQPPMTQLSAPIDAPKKMNLTTGEWIALWSLVFVILTCIAAWLVVPEAREVILSFVRGGIPALTPTASPPPTP